MQTRSYQENDQAEGQKIERNSSRQRRLPERAITLEMLDEFHFITFLSARDELRSLYIKQAPGCKLFGQNGFEEL